MLAGSVSGLTFYFAVSSFAAALVAFVVSAVIMVCWTFMRPQPFDWKTLRAAGTRETDNAEASVSEEVRDE
jgi:hypothetical protein